MKKLLSFALVALMVISSVVPAFAVSLTDVPAAADNTIDLWVSDAEIDDNNQVTVTVSLANNIGFWSLWTYMVYPKCLTIDGNVEANVKPGAIIEKSNDFYLGPNCTDRTWIADSMGDALINGYGVDVSYEVAQVNWMVDNDPDCQKAKEGLDTNYAKKVAAEKVAWGKLGYASKADCAWEKAFGFEKYNCSGNFMLTYEDSVYGEFNAVDGALYDITFTYHPELNTEGTTEFEIIVIADPLSQLHKIVGDAMNGDHYTLRLHNGTVTLKEEEVPSILYGDVNGDGKINLTDVTMLKRYWSNYNQATGTSTIKVQPGADCNGDGKINLTDVTMLKRYWSNYDQETGESSIKLGPR